ncbi:ABC transporter permease [Candidatus Bipolaricaulota bacterium]|nr:ABC transporter permease [Candidatus Bipolaricaulota bacterium]
MFEWAILPKFILDGLFLGSYYGLLALGISIVFGILDIGDVAQGGLFTVGAYLTYTVVELLGFNYFLVPLFVVPMTALVSLFFGTFIYRKLRQYGIAPTFLGAVSLLLLVQSSVSMIFGERAKTVGSPVTPRMIEVGKASIFFHKLLVILATICLAIAVWYLIQKTRWGRALRAASQNREAAALAGVSFASTTAAAFALAGALAGLSGFLTAPVYTFTPFTGRLPVLKAFVISRLSLGSIPAVLALSAVIGIAESLGSVYFLGEFSNLIPFGLLILVALIRPGVLGPEERAQIRRNLTAKVRFVFPQLKRAFRFTGLLILFLPALVDFPPYFLHLAITIGTVSIAVTSLDLLYGYVGSPSLAQGAFFGIGAYGSAVLTMQFGGSVFLGLSGGIIISMLIGFFVGMVGVRTGRHWTSFTFVSTIVFTILFNNLDFVTGGPSGISGVPILSLKLPGLTGIEFNPFADKLAYYFLVVFVLATVLFFKNLVLKSWFGRSIKAIREDEGLARSVGIPTRTYKIIAFVISAGVAGLAGSLYGHYVRFLHPELFNFVTSFRFLMMNRIGGLGSILGPVLGATGLTSLKEFTQPLTSYFTEFVFSGVLILALIYFPEGIAGGLRRLFARVLPERYVRKPEQEDEKTARATGEDR